MSSIRLESILLCDLIVVAPERKFQLQGVFDRIFTSRLPIRHSRAFLYFRFYVSEAETGSKLELRLALTSPAGGTEQLSPTSVKVGQRGKVEGYIQLVGVPLRDSGHYRLRLFADEQEVGFYSFEVVLVRSDQSGTGSQMVH